MKRLRLSGLVFLLMTIFATAALAGAGDWKQIGKSGEWASTVAAASHAGKLYTADRDGRLYVAEPKTGKWKPLGKDTTWNTRFLWSACLVKRYYW